MFVTNFFESGFIVPADPPGPDLTRDGRFRLLRVAGVEQQAQYTRVTVARLLEPDATVEILVISTHHPRLSDGAVASLAALLPDVQPIFIRSLQPGRAEATYAGPTSYLSAATAVATVVMVQSLDDLDRLAVEVGGHMVDVVLHRSDGRYVADAVSRSARQY